MVVLDVVVVEVVVLVVVVDDVVVVLVLVLVVVVVGGTLVIWNESKTLFPLSIAWSVNTVSSAIRTDT